MNDVNTAINKGIDKLIQDFRCNPEKYFTEEDIRWQLLREIENVLVTEDLDKIPYSGGTTSRIHTEYPTPFRCSMRQRQFAVLDATNKTGQRGHFDVVFLNSEAAKNCNFETLRSQYYKQFCEELVADRIPLPFLDYAIELKLFRELAHPNRTESAKQQAEYAAQAVNKLEATLIPNNYYSKPFAYQAIALLFDNSELTDSKNVEVARGKFHAKFQDLIDWQTCPSGLTCIWVSSTFQEVFQGKAMIKHRR